MIVTVSRGFVRVLSTTKRSLGSAVRAQFWYREFREIVLMFAIPNIEQFCEKL
jgi:hypothetical protein